MLTIHFFFKYFFLTMTTFETQPSGQNICSQVASNGSPLCGKKVVLFFLRCALWSWREMKTNELNKREQLIHCCELPPRLFTCLSEALIAILSLAISFAACLPRSCCGHKQCCFPKKKKLWVCCDLLPRVYFLVHNLDTDVIRKSPNSVI